MAKLIVVVEDFNKVLGAVEITIPEGLEVTVEKNKVQVRKATRITRSNRFQYIRPSNTKVVPLVVADTGNTEYIA
jgi:hypothetical protein